MSDQRGALPVVDSADGVDGATAPVLTTEVGGKDSSGNLQTLLTDTRGSLFTSITTPNLSLLGLSASVSVTGALSVAPPAGTLFSDTFDSAGIDTTNRWNITLATGGTQVQSLGKLTLATTTAASSSVQLSSQPTFTPAGSFYYFGVNMTYESPLQTNTHRFWGFGTPAVSFTAATPLLNAIGFEIDTSGNLSAVVYSSGTKILSTNLNAYKSSSQLSYIVVLRADTALFYISTVGYEIPVASFPNFALDSFILPYRTHIINGTTPPASAPSIAMSSLVIGDSDASNTTQLSDGTFAWRKAAVSKNADVYTRDVINTSSQYRAQSVTTSAAEAIGAASRLANRKLLTITPTNGTIYWGTSNAVTTATGQPLAANQTLTLAFTDNVPIYVIAASTVDARILEAS